MTWVKLDDGFPENPKVATLSPAAIGLHVCALCYCNRNLTDGEIRKGIEKRLTSTSSTSRLVNQLVGAGLWLDEGESWRIHDYLDFQPSKAKVQADRAAALERQRRSRERRAAAKSSVTEVSQRDKPVSHGPVTAPRPVPDPTPTTSPLTPHGSIDGQTWTTEAQRAALEGLQSVKGSLRAVPE